MLNFLSRFSLRGLPLLLSSTIAVLLLGYGTWLWLSPSSKASAPKAGAQGAMAIPVQLTTVEPTAVSDSSDYVAIADARASADLRPQAEGYLTQILVQPGQAVHAGQVLFVLDNQRQQARVASAVAAQQVATDQMTTTQANLKALDASLTQAKARLVYAEQEFNRRVALKGTDALSQQDYDRTETELKQAKAGVQQVLQQMQAQQAVITAASSGIKQAGAAKQLEQTELGYFQVKAPINGYMGDIPVHVGEAVTRSTMLSSISQLSTIELEVALPADKAHQLNRSLPLQLLDSEGQPFGKAFVSFVSPQVDVQSQTVLVRARYANPQQRVRHQQRVPVRVVWHSTNKLTVPTKAVQRQGGQPFVYQALVEPQAVKANQPYDVKQVPLKLGAISNNQYTVEEGLSEDAVVVTEGIQKIQPGAKVMKLAYRKG